MVRSSSVAEHETVPTYLNYLREQMGLKDWKIRYSLLTPADEDDEATITFAVGQRSAAVRLGERFWKLTPPQQRHTLVHELVHVHLRLLISVVDSVEAALGVAASTVLGHNLDSAHEYATDAIALVIEHHLRAPKFARHG